MIDRAFAEIVRAARKRPLWTPHPSTRELEVDRAGIERVLPHRGGMLMLDAITAIDLSQMCLRATRHLQASDPGFAGHFPGDPVYPASLQLEIGGQAGVCLVDFVRRKSIDLPGEAPRDMRVIKLHHAVMLAEARPGVTVRALAKLLVSDELTSIFAVQLVNPEAILCVAIMEVCYVG